MNSADWLRLKELVMVMGLYAVSVFIMYDAESNPGFYGLFEMIVVITGAFLGIIVGVRKKRKWLLLFSMVLIPQWIISFLHNDCWYDISRLVKQLCLAIRI